MEGGEPAQRCPTLLMEETTSSCGLNCVDVRFYSINNMISIKIERQSPAMTRGFLHISRYLLN